MATKIRQAPKKSKTSHKGVQHVPGSHNKPHAKHAKAAKPGSIDSLPKGVTVKEYPSEGKRHFSGVKIVGHSG